MHGKTEEVQMSRLTPHIPYKKARSQLLVLGVFVLVIQLFLFLTVASVQAGSVMDGSVTEEDSYMITRIEPLMTGSQP